MYNIMFYSFPKNLTERMTWLKSCDLIETDYAPSRRICSRHFSEKDLLPPSMKDNRRCLRPGSVPRLSCYRNKSVKNSSNGSSNTSCKIQINSSNKVLPELSLKTKMLDYDNSQSKAVSCSSTMPFNHLITNDFNFCSSDSSKLILFEPESINLKNESLETTFEQNEPHNENCGSQSPYYTNDYVSSVFLSELSETVSVKSELSETVSMKSEYTDSSYGFAFSNSLMTSNNDIYHLHNEIDNSSLCMYGLCETMDVKSEMVNDIANEYPPTNCSLKDKSCSSDKDEKLKCTSLQEKHKKMSYGIDIKLSDFSSPIKAKRNFHKAKQHIIQQNDKIKKYQQKVRKLIKRINLMKDELKSYKTAK
ncbi:Hypothetical protein CINCED_3A001827 [Cinara cedri]|uniref:THAP-type domain-containing protein n=1 Tax=Cinara cedri TaxID=506608 RepID=A0A5E4MBB1_9HEMI|nr:Hypothetical protein CINCED_3A001827 [Cinara cedri]